MRHSIKWRWIMAFRFDDNRLLLHYNTLLLYFCHFLEIYSQAVTPNILNIFAYRHSNGCYIYILIFISTNIYTNCVYTIFLYSQFISRSLYVAFIIIIIMIFLAQKWRHAVFQLILMNHIQYIYMKVVMIVLYVFAAIVPSAFDK